MNSVHKAEPTAYKPASNSLADKINKVEPTAYSIADEVNKHRIVLAGLPWCGFCNRAKAQLEKAQVDYHFVALNAVGTIEENRRILDSLSNHGKCSVPYFFVDGKYSGGCNDGPEPWMGVRTMIQTGKLAALLASEPSQ
jgi:glutaredoxin